jgi:regulator of cell morphogenesis and NO signaling
MLEATAHHTLADVVLYNFRAAEVFENMKLDFFCNGRQTIQEACQQKNLDISEVIEQVNKAIRKHAKENETFNIWDLDFIVFYITEKHHAYTKNALRRINDYCYRIADLYGNSQPELWNLHSSFRDIADIMQKHLVEEERNIFPLIKKLFRNKLKSVSGSYADEQGPDILTFAICLTEEQKQVTAAMEYIKHLTDDYYIPDYAGRTYKAAFEELKRFEKDIHQHFHIENNILFPKAIMLKEELSY